MKNRNTCTYTSVKNFVEFSSIHESFQFSSTSQVPEKQFLNLAFQLKLSPMGIKKGRLQKETDLIFNKLCITTQMKAPGSMATRRKKGLGF